MKIRRKVVFAGLTAILAAATAHAQMEMGIRGPQFRGVWNPIVGSGGRYEVEAKGEPKTQVEIAVAGKETVEGKPAYWLEMAMKAPEGEGEIYSKSLIVLEGKQNRVTRMIFQAPGQPPMEMPIEMMQHGTATEQPADIRDEAELVGSETITTPAGTFACEHYRLKDGSADAWVTQKVAPYGLVKMTGRNANLTLIKVIIGAKTHITGTPMKFNPMEMMRRPPEQLR